MTIHLSPCTIICAFVKYISRVEAAWNCRSWNTTNQSWLLDNHALSHSVQCSLYNKQSSQIIRSSRSSYDFRSMTTVNLFWLLAGLFHTNQWVLQLPIASNTCVQLLQCRKNESPRLNTWRYFACTINKPNHLNCPHYCTRGGAVVWGNAL